MKYESKEKGTFIKCSKRIISQLLSTVLILGLFLFSPISSMNVHADENTMTIIFTFSGLGVNDYYWRNVTAQHLSDTENCVGDVKLEIASIINKNGTAYTPDQLKFSSSQHGEMVDNTATLDKYIDYRDGIQVIVTVTVKGNSSSTATESAASTATESASTPSTPHTHNFVWTTVQEVTTEQDGLEELRCECGAVEGRSVIPASQVFVKGLYGQIKNAAENGTVSFDSGKLYTISDYLIKKLQERNDVTTVINFEYQQVKYRMTIPAGKDYTKLLEDQDYFYGYLFFANEIGATVEAL